MCFKKIYAEFHWLIKQSVTVCLQIVLSVISWDVYRDLKDLVLLYILQFWATCLMMSLVLNQFCSVTTIVPVHTVNVLKIFKSDHFFMMNSSLSC